MENFIATILIIGFVGVGGFVAYLAFKWYWKLQIKVREKLLDSELGREAMQAEARATARMMSALRDAQEEESERGKRD